MASLHKFPNAPARGIGAGTRSPPAPISFQPSADDPGPRFVRPIDNLLIARSMHDEPTRRAIEARLNGIALHERIQHRKRVVRDQGRIGLACMAVSAAAVLYFIAELARLAF